MLESQYGKKGAAAFAVFSRGEADLDMYARRFDRYYKSGKIGLSFDQIPAELIAESPHLAKVAFDAGVRDAKETTVKSFAGAGQMGYNGGTGKSVTEPQMDSFHALEDRYAEMEQGWKDAPDRPSTDAKSSLKDPASQVTSYENGRVGSPSEGAGDVLPNVEKVTVDTRKVTEYALNPNNTSGGANKARVFESALGYNQSNSNHLIQQIQNKLPNSKAVLGIVDKYGQRFTVDIPITGPNGKTAIVRTG